MTPDFRRMVAISTRPGPGETIDDALIANEAATWGMFGTVVEQHTHPRGGSLLTFVKVGPAGRRSLEALLTGRYLSRLAPEALQKDRA